ncbi:MAG TPA: hypothetical protein VNZ55_09160 [Thermomicrobiales bacterium]|nr:hypothetical protein [Thermomicrobiales bacterium]
MTIDVAGGTEAALIANALRAVFRHTDDLPEDGAETNGEIIGFRATGKQLADVLVNAIHAALDEADAQRVTVLGVDVAGVMPIDEGLRCWGYLATSARSEGRPTCTIEGEPAIVRRDDRFSAEFTLRIECP